MFLLVFFSYGEVKSQIITSAGQPAQLDIRVAGSNSIRITLKPVSFKEDFPVTPALAERKYPAPVLSLRTVTETINKKVGALHVQIRPDPLTLIITNAKGQTIQTISFNSDGNLSFKLDNQPVLGLGEGGPRPVKDWRNAPVEFDRRGRLHKMEPRWQADAYGSRNPAAVLVGTDGWGLFMATPWVQVDLQNKEYGTLIPRWTAEVNTTPQTVKNQQLVMGKGLPPVDKIVPGLYDFFVFDAHEPAWFMKDFSVITGPAVLPPKWALGYMQSHRTLVDENQMIGIVDTFRAKKIPVDAVIYLGTGFAPRGWNKEQPSFEYNPEVFHRNPSAFFSDMHNRNVKVILHMVPWDRDKLPTLHGTIPAKPGEVLDSSHIQNYWSQHVGLLKSGADGFWPDEGDWFNLFERIKRHQMYYQGSLSTNPNIRPWSLHRNGFPGIAQWGGWVWSGDTESSWKTLEAQIAVGLNYSLSIGPFWGTDIGGFYSNEELTGELYARWFQFATFCASFRSHGRTWRTRLPWGWGLSSYGPAEDKQPPLQSELNNPAIEPVVKKYDELRYRLLPYTYTLAWQARTSGMPPMRPLWLHYSNDTVASKMSTEFLWGREMLIAPVFEKGATVREVYLPKGNWYDWWNNKLQKGGKTITRQVDLSTMPVYVRAGAIIPVDALKQYTAEVVKDPLTIKIYRGANGSFTLYEDDGISQDYLKGKATLTNFVWNDFQKKLTIKPGIKSKNFNSGPQRVFRIELLPMGTIKKVKYYGKTVEVAF